MSEIIHLDTLTVRDANAVARLERASHARAVREGREYFHDLLQFVDRTGWGLNIGLYSGRRLIGYVISHETDTSVMGGPSDEYVVYVADIAVHPKYTCYFSRLLAGYLRHLSTLFPTHAVEAHGIESVVKLWARHRRFFKTNGYELNATLPTGRTILGQSYYALRWHPLAPDHSRPANRGHHTHRTQYSYLVDGYAYTVEALTDENEWHELIPYWNDLLLKTSEPTMFQTYEYQRIWWRHFGLARNLLILIIRDGHEVIGIAPLQITPVMYYGKLFRELGYIGVNWEVDRPKFLFGEQVSICSTLTARFLKEHEQLWDLLRLYEQRENSFVLSGFRSEMQNYGYLTAITKDAVAPYLRTDATWEAFSKSRSARMRKNLKAARKKLEVMGQFEYVECKAYPDVLEKLEWYKQIEQKSWKGNARVGPSKHGHYYRFFEALAGEFGQTGQFHIRFITLDNQPIAGTFGLEFNDTFYSLHIAHDHEYNKYSIGTLLEFMELESCFKGACVEYDFLGSFLNNKLRWTSTVRTSKELHVYQKQWRLVLLFVVYHRIKPLIKKIAMKILKDKVQVLVKLKEKMQRAANRRPSAE